MSGFGMMRGRDIVVDDVLDRIYKAWISHKVEDLSIQDLAILERMEFIDALLNEGGARSRYKNVLDETYEYFKRDHENIGSEVTKRTIETDIARTQRFFLTTRPRAEKDYAKGMSIKHGYRMLDIFEAKGKDKEWNVLYKELNDLEGFHKEDIERPDYDAVQPPPIMVVADPADIGVPVIDNLEEELRLLRAPKKEYRNTDNIDDAEVIGDGE